MSSHKRKNEDNKIEDQTMAIKIRKSDAASSSIDTNISEKTSSQKTTENESIKRRRIENTFNELTLLGDHEVWIFFFSN
jgi:hypothetical protein